ncbi:MAG: RidA family protein [Sandaracinus sp.]|nr:RidA family protein [Sandaracinus sp.]MCB9618689.1 RidA family protein [Sandaracinus sp.]
MTTVVNPSTLAAPRGYSNGLLMPTGQVLFVAGQIGWTKEAKLVDGGMAPQFAQAMQNVIDVLTEAGGRPEHVGRLTIYVTDKRAYLAATKEIGAAYRACFGKHYPAMALVQVADLLEDGAMVEIEATAVIPEEAR